MAALDVVHKRLTEAGLGDFLLELHSAKSGKKPVLESIRKRLAIESWRSLRDQPETVEERRQVAERLHSYADAVNTSFGRSGWTVHDLVWRNFGYRNRSVPHALQTFDFPEVESLTQNDIDVRIKALADWHECKARYSIEAAEHRSIKSRAGANPRAGIRQSGAEGAEGLSQGQL